LRYVRDLRYVRAMELGYARVSTVKHDLDRQRRWSTPGSTVSGSTSIAASATVAASERCAGRVAAAWVHLS